MKIEEYKGFTIKAENYLIGLSTVDETGKTLIYGKGIVMDWGNTNTNYYQIFEGDRCISNTLANDDKMWTLPAAFEAAKRDIDAYLERGRISSSPNSAYL